MRFRAISALALLVLIAPGLFLFSGCTSPVIPVEAKAAIIDQLDPADPNPAFIAKAITILQNNGFKTDYYEGSQVTLDLYRRLPALGYRILIFRAHSGLLGNGTKASQKTCLFTNQPYSQTAEIGDQLSNRLVKACVNENPPVFGIGADFVTNSLRARFNRTAVIMMGCSSLESNDLARSFIDRGASVYTGWNASVGLIYVEEATLVLLDKMFQNSLPVESALMATIQEKGTDPKSGAELKYYTESGANKTLTELLN